VPPPRYAPARPVTSLGHQEGRRVFREGLKFFELCPIVSNYVQHIFSGGAKNFLGGLLPPWLRAWPLPMDILSLILALWICIEIRNSLHEFCCSSQYQLIDIVLVEERFSLSLTWLRLQSSWFSWALLRLRSFFFHNMAPAQVPVSVRLCTLIFSIVLVCLKLNWKWNISSKQNQKNMSHLFE